MSEMQAQQGGSGFKSATLQPLTYCRSHVRSFLKWAAVAVIAVELGGIWNEVHHIRTEQVKSEWYALSPTAQRVIANRGSMAKKLYESSSNADVEGKVSIDNEPVEVEIDR